MNDRPDAQDLLAIARETYVREILPELPERLRYTALMIANAMAIAQRWVAAGDQAAHAELKRLQALLPEAIGESEGTALHAILAAYNLRLVREIRAGRFDGAERGELLQHLRRTTEEKLAVSNPKGLR